MRVTGNLMPTNTFSIEPLPKKHGYVLVRFYDNITSLTHTTLDGVDHEVFVYDEYHLEMKNTNSVYNDVETNLDVYLSQAKSLEKNDPAKLPSRVNTLEDEKADKTEVNAVWEQMAAAYSEGVQEA